MGYLQLYLRKPLPPLKGTDFTGAGALTLLMSSTNASACTLVPLLCVILDRSRYYCTEDCVASLGVSSRCSATVHVDNVGAGDRVQARREAHEQ